MKRIFSNPGLSLTAGLVIAAVVLLASLFDPSLDRLGVASFLVRWVHVLGAMIWVGMIWFVNFVQIAAVSEADDAGRTALLKSVVPRVAQIFRHASHLTLATGLILLVTTGYVLDNFVFQSAVYIPTLRSALLWIGAAGGLAMWAFVHFLIWPNLQIVLGATADAAAKAAARERVHVYARVNLMLALPVTFAMIAAAHLS